MIESSRTISTAQCLIVFYNMRLTVTRKEAMKHCSVICCKSFLMINRYKPSCLIFLLYFAVERRRRFNINDRIKELGGLLPRTIDP